MVFVKKRKFFQFLILGKIAQENVLDDILGSKKACLDYEKRV